MKQLALVLSFVVLVLAAQISANTIHVPDDQPTIQAAINAAVNGDIILVGPGTFTQSFDFKGKTLQVIGAGGGATTLQGVSVNFSSNEGTATLLSGFTAISTNISILGTARPTISDCIFHNCTDPIYLNTTDALITRNLFYNNLGISCVEIYGGSARIINNTFDHNNRGFFSISGRGDARNNIVTNSRDYGIAGSMTTMQYNLTWKNNPDYYSVSPGIGSLTADPLYVDAVALDYRLLPNSPAVNQGDPDAAYLDPDGSRNDMGAFPLEVGPYIAHINMGQEVLSRVVSATPTLYWSFLESGQSQAAFEIEVGTDLDWSTAEMWKPGAINSSDTSIAYGGSPLLVGKSYYIRARVSDGTQWSKWLTQAFYMDSRPTIPTLWRPAEGTSMAVTLPSLVVLNSSDPDADALKYDFELYSDAGLTSRIEVQSSVPQQTDSTVVHLTSALSVGATYWWRARAWDGYAYSDWSAASSFVGRAVITIHVPADYSTIQSGMNAAAPGDIVLVSAGTYSQGLDFKGKAIKVIGVDPAITTLTGSVVRIVSGEPVGAEFTGFTLTGSQFQINGGAKPTIDNCIFRNCPDPITTENSDPLVTRNLFYNNTGISCVEIYSGSGRIINNTFDANYRGFFSISGQGEARNNIVTNSRDYGIAGGFSSLEYNLVWQNHPDYYENSPGVGSLSLDPIFVEPLAHDYHLTAASPAVDHGDPSPTYFDPDGSRNDMGALMLLPGPYAIRINMGSDPVSHVVSLTPTFYWTFAEKGGSQTAFELEVGTDSNWTVAEKWKPGVMNLPDTSIVYAGSALYPGGDYVLRLRVSDGSIWSPWKLLAFHMNAVPTVPELYFPIDGQKLPVRGPVLTIRSSTDLEYDSVYYDFELYTDAGLSVLAETQKNVPGPYSMTSITLTTPLVPGSEYWWRARATDRHGYSAWADAANFVARGPMTIHVPSDAFTMQVAINASATGDSIIVLPGTYSNQTINFQGKGLIFVGSGADTTIFRNANINFLLGEPAGTLFSGFTLIGSKVQISGTSQPTVSDCVFHDCVDPIVLNTTDALITRNLFYNNTGISCVEIYSGSARIINNTFDHNNRGFFSISGLGEARNNIVTNSVEYGIAGTMSAIEYNDAWNNRPDYQSTGGGVGSISVDPVYVDKAGYDYHLTFGSPCINTGDPAPKYNDADGTRNDMGALPFSPPYVKNVNFGAEKILRIVSHTPTIYWSFVNPDAPQSDYEIEVGTNLNWNVAEMWKSGVIHASDTFAVYAGAPLSEGSTYYLRLRATSGGKWSTWANVTFHLDAAPSVPTLQSPIAGQIVTAAGFYLVILNGTDADGDSLKYDFEIYQDQGLSNRVASEVGMKEQKDSTSSDMFGPIASNATYWWRSRSYDGYRYSSWSGSASLFARPPVMLHVPQDQSSIQAAITQSGNGDTVQVDAGTYTETLSLAGRNLVIRTALGPRRTILTSDSSKVLVTFGKGVDIRTVFEGFTLKGGSVGILCQNSSPTIRHNVLAHQGYGNVPAIVLGGTAIKSVGASAARIINNTITDSRDGGIASYSTVSPTIRNNILAFNATVGVFVSSPDKALLGYNDVFGNQTNYQNVTDSGTGSFKADPYLGIDYGVIQASPCVDAGDPDPLYNDPDGTRNDIGALYLACCVANTRGDINGSGRVDLADLSYLVTYLTIPNVPLACFISSNIDGRGIVDMADLSILVAYLTREPGSIHLPPCSDSPYKVETITSPSRGSR